MNLGVNDYFSGVIYYIAIVGDLGACSWDIGKSSVDLNKLQSLYWS
jgi:hypothetical protein